jgi:hypothetical protein
MPGCEEKQVVAPLKICNSKGIRFLVKPSLWNPDFIPKGLTSIFLIPVLYNLS